MVKTQVSANGQIVLPPPDEGLVRWLLDCPDKDYFVPVESDSTDDLGPGA